MELTPDRLPAQLAAEPLRPAYLVAGAETLRVLEAADAIRAAARTQGIAEREVFETERGDIDWDCVAASLHAPSLFASRRLIELRLPTAKPGKVGGQLIIDYCAAPPADVVLLVTGNEWSARHDGKWSQAIGAVGHIVSAMPVRPHELVAWIERRLRARGIRADAGAVQRLAERVEGNLLAAAQEIDKLALLDDGTPIDAARMDALVADAARYDVFRLIDATLNGQAVQVARMLAGMQAEGISVHALLGMLVRELQSLAGLARAQASGANLANVFKAQRIWDSKQAMYRRALQRHDAAQWERLLVEIGRVDRIAKGRAAGDEWQVLERLLVAAATPGALVLLAG